MKLIYVIPADGVKVFYLWRPDCKKVDEDLKIIKPFGYTVHVMNKRLIFKSDYEFLLKLLKS